MWLDPDEAWWRRCQGHEAEALVSYLEHFPRGRHNREAAERLEALGDRLRGEAQRALRARLRALRQPHLGPIAPNTWAPPGGRRRAGAVPRSS